MANVSDDLLTYEEMLAEYINSMKNCGKDPETIRRECVAELELDIVEGIVEVAPGSVQLSHR